MLRRFEFRVLCFFDCTWNLVYRKQVSIRICRIRSCIRDIRNRTHVRFLISLGANLEFFAVYPRAQEVRVVRSFRNCNIRYCILLPIEEKCRVSVFETDRVVLPIYIRIHRIEPGFSENGVVLCTKIHNAKIDCIDISFHLRRQGNVSRRVFKGSVTHFDMSGFIYTF
jgi:hypothetical protein